MRIGQCVADRFQPATRGVPFLIEGFIGLRFYDKCAFNPDQCFKTEHCGTLITTNRTLISCVIDLRFLEQMP